VFHSPEYLRHTQRVQEHLVTLELQLFGRSVLEVGAGIGDHTSFFLDRNCLVTVTEGRPENVTILRRRYPEVAIHELDVEHPPADFAVRAELVYCYGLIYHVATPDRVLAYLAERCEATLLLESCVSFGAERSVNPVTEARHDRSQALHGTGCRPTRPWIWEHLERHFPHVYATRTQPWHENFPLDWTDPGGHRGSLARAVFVASREPLHSPQLIGELPARQARC
jgi:hypothetical protein